VNPVHFSATENAAIGRGLSCSTDIELGFVLGAELGNLKEESDAYCETHASSLDSPCRTTVQSLRVLGDLRILRPICESCDVITI
jgi:hypothetical protein